ncbi:hypothetical protein D3C72_1140980 [compost metagenome]
MFQKARSTRRALGVARHQQHLQARVSGPSRIGQLPAVQGGQAHIGDQQVDIGRAQHEFQAGFAIGRSQHLHAQFSQAFVNHVAHIVVIFHQHDHRRLRIVLRAVGSGFGSLRGVRGAVITRQQQPDRGALAHHAFQYRHAARLLGEPVDHRQAQPRALAQGLGGEEGIEGMGQHVRRHPAAHVRDGDFNELSWADAGIRTQRGLIQLRIQCRNGQLAAIGHGVASVDDQVQQRILKLIAVAPHRPQVRLQLEPQPHALARVAMKQVAHGLQRGGHAERLRVDGLAP